MFFNSKDFKALEAGIQFTSMSQQLHLQNIANMETPGYKTKSLEFENALKAAQSSNVRNSVARAKIVTDESTSVLNDGNNVDFEKENIELYKSYVQYTALLNKVKGQFDNYNYVLNVNLK